MGRYATREEEIDRMLRAGLFVDLYQIVRRGLRASVESYSIKQMEQFYAFTRGTPLADANSALANFQAHLELSDAPSIADDIKATVQAYNEDDCRSAASLRHWLEALRARLVAEGIDVTRPQLGDGPMSRSIPWSGATSSRLGGSWPTSWIGTGVKKRRFGGNFSGWPIFRRKICARNAPDLLAWNLSV
jgi:uncharacterized protein